MKKDQFRVFKEGEYEFSFNCHAFRSIFDHFSKKENCPKGQMDAEIAELLCVSPDAVKNWKYGKNGPAELEMIKKLAKYFHIDWKSLTKKVEGESTMTLLTERQKASAKRIYDILIWFLETFNNTDGFNDWWLDFKRKGSVNPEDDIYERIALMENRVHLVLNQEYFDLHDHEIYNEFYEFTNEDLIDIYNGKISYAYRFEADGENSPKLWQDYEKAMQHLNQIIERYV